MRGNIGGKFRAARDNIKTEVEDTSSTQVINAPHIEFDAALQKKIDRKIPSVIPKRRALLMKSFRRGPTS